MKKYDNTKQFEDEYAANMEVTNQAIKEWQAEKDISDDEVNEVIAFFTESIGSLLLDTENEEIRQHHRHRPRQ